MGRVTRKSNSISPESRPALSPDAREAQMVGYAIDLAEKQLREGTASSQVITHFLKLGTSRNELEKEKIRAEIEEKKAKVKAIESGEEMKHLYENAIAAMRDYSGLGGGRDEIDDEFEDNEWDEY